MDDRATPDGALVAAIPERLADRMRVVRGAAAGPAAARNVGWRSVANAWVAFLDDDVEVTPGWLAGLARDMAAAEPGIAGVQGRVRVPLAAGARPTDWERNVAGLEAARWATADLVYRRAALAEVGGFDERFPRAYREDADLGLRLLERGWRIIEGERQVRHPVRPADAWVSVRLQAGNADDARMRVRHGPAWRVRAGVPSGRRSRHLAVTGAALIGLAAAWTGRPRLVAVAALAWLVGTLELAMARILPGPRSAREVGVMLATSVAIPHAASWHWLRGWAGILGEHVVGGGRGRAVRVLLWHVHGSYTTALVQGHHTYLLPVTPDRGPDGRGRGAYLELARRPPSR